MQATFWGMEVACYGSGFVDGRREDHRSGYEQGGRAFLEHMPDDLVSEYWARFEAAHERGEG